MVLSPALLCWHKTDTAGQSVSLIEWEECCFQTITSPLLLSTLGEAQREERAETGSRADVENTLSGPSPQRQLLHVPT